MSERFRLIIDKFPNDDSIRQCCELIYQTTDSKLIASMGSTPYEIGRSFSSEEKTELKLNFAKLQIEFRFINESTGAVESHQPPKTDTPQAKAPQSPIRITKLGVFVSLGVFSFFAILFVSFQFFLKSDPNTTTPIELLDEKAQVQPEPSRPELEAPNAIPVDIEFFEAQIVEVENKVEIRRKNEIEWQKAKQEMLLQEGDRIRTFSRAHCSLKYREGSSVQISEDSLVVVGKAEDQKELISRELALENGSLRTQLVAGMKDQQIGIETKRGFVQFKHSKDAQQSTQFETAMRNNQLNVRVARGTAEFKKSKDDLGSVPILSNQQIMVTPTSVSEPVDYRPPLRLFNPQDGSQIAYQGQKIAFQWENVDLAVYDFTLAGDVEMESVLFNKQTLDNNIELNYLDSGYLFWQVTATSDGITYFSPIYRLHVQ